MALGLVIPLFVAMDPVGTLPLFVAWTGGLTAQEREQQLRGAVLTAPAVCVLFMVGGRWLLSILGVGVADFLVAGGLVLLVLAGSDLVTGGGHEARGSSATRDIAAVPIGTPILAGPATLTTLLILVERYGTLLALLAGGEPHCRLAPVLSRAGSQKNRFVHCTAYYRSLQRFAIAVRTS